MSLLAILWTIVGILCPLLVGAALTFIGYAPPEFAYARACFIGAACVLLVMEIYWATTTESAFFARLIVGVPLLLLIGIGLPEALQWVNARQALARGDVKPNDDPVAIDALYVGVRNMPERKSVQTWNSKPWDEDEYADVRVNIANILDLALQDLTLDINATEDDPKYIIAGIAQLTKVNGISFQKPPIPAFILTLKGADGKMYNLPMPDQQVLDEHRVVSHETMFCPRLESKAVIRLILATAHVERHNIPPPRLNITGSYITESAEGRRIGKVSLIIPVRQ